MFKTLPIYSSSILREKAAVQKQIIKTFSTDKKKEKNTVKVKRKWFYIIQS